MKLFLITLCGCLITSVAYGTAQFPDKILYRGQENDLVCAPLEKYFDANHPSPEELHPTSTDCSRGYVGTWEIKEKTLYLESLGRLYIGIDEKTGKRKRLIKEIPISLIFKDKKPPIKATWYTGALIIPQGTVLRNVRSGFETIYEKELYIIVKEGLVVKELLIDNKGKGAILSRDDIEWVALADESVKDHGKWYDARLIYTDSFRNMRESEVQFITRGIFLKRQTGKPCLLQVPQTPTTREVRFVLESLMENPKSGTHIEIKTHFKKGDNTLILYVDSIRPLKLGETIHHPSFKTPDK